jgi:hypothetical protein
MNKRLVLITVACGVLAMSTACGGGDDGDDGGDDSGGCSGDITGCPLPELTEDQQGAFCDTLLAAIDDPPGTTYECSETGLFLTVNTRDACAATVYAAGCPITGAQLIACYKAAAMDACTAFSETGGCAVVFENAEACVN